MNGWRALAGAILIAAVIVGGCLSGSPGTSTPAATPTASTPAPAGVSVLILTPEFDGGVPAGDVTVTVRVTGVALVPPGGPDRPGEGHLVYYRDTTPSTVPGESALTAPGTYAVSSGTAYTWTGIAPGTHTFAVQLVQSDNTPFDPPAIDAVDVTAVSSRMIAGG